MKRQISHKQSAVARIIFVIAGFSIPFLALLFPVTGLSPYWFWAIGILSIVTGSICLYCSFKLNTVAFDNEFIYCTGFGKARKIGLEKITYIRPMAFPLRLFAKNNYVMKLEYSDDQLNKKIYFLSKGSTGFSGTTDTIPYLDTIKELIRSKKYNH